MSPLHRGGTFPRHTYITDGQYHPTPRVSSHPLLGRTILREEYDAVLDEMRRLGFHRGWVQELESHHSYLPDFDQPGVFDNG